MIEIKSVEEFNELVNKNSVNVIDFYANWCVPCQRLKISLDEIIEEKQYDIYSVNVETLPEIASKYRIMTIPTILIFYDNNVISQLINPTDKFEIIKEMEQTYFNVC